MRATKDYGGYVHYNGKECAIKRKFANVGVGTDQALVTAVTGKKIIVISAFVNAVTTGVATLIFNTKPAGAGTAISSTFSCAANGGAVLNRNPDGWFETSAGEGLTATVATNIVGVMLNYIEAE